MRRKMYAVLVREFGRGKPAREHFATLAEAAEYVKSQWMGCDYVDGPDQFHGDYCSFTFIGFTFHDIGITGWTDDGCRTFTFHNFDVDGQKVLPPMNPECHELDYDGADRGL